MIILIGASASGKTEIAKKLINNYSFQKVITYTTRLPRKNETNNIDYHFVTIEKFLKLKEEDFFLETTLYNENYYGTAKNEIGLNKILIVDPKGYAAYRKINDATIISFYINVEESVRKERMFNRGDCPDDIAKRLLNDQKDFSFNNIGITDFVIDSRDMSITELADEINSKYYKKIIDTN
ncbi:MAG: hypothetical protein RSE56_02830 [Bacilli bacterium]